ncbi:protein broad-minded-like [Patiria miniata]|uniref:Protein broad-minded n=1 Tax=Patiria miniata TaxID=46514 RepID=A0A914B1D3_PATMI|nr:protein broad-minded-like [Patiria miniata]
MADPLGSDEDLLPSIRQLISSIKLTLRAAGSQTTALEMVTHLEETDDNFHRYELVKYIRGRIEEVLGPLIEEEIERRSLDVQSKGGEEVMVRMITDHVINDQASLDLMNSLKHCTKDAVDRLIRLFDEEYRPVQNSMFGNIPGMYGQGGGMPSPKRNSFCFSDDSSSLDSSFNQGSYTFMNQEHFATIADNLAPDKPLEMRRETLHGLCKLPPSDILACEHWDSLRSVLLIALSDSDDILAETSLHFHARMFSSNSHHVMREVYTGLVEHLTEMFTDHSAKISPLRDGVDMAHHATSVLLRKFRLMNEFNLEIPTYWVRFPDRFLDDVTESTMNLLVTEPQGLRSSSAQPLITPLHCMAIVDPRASWFRKWMHGNYGRTSVIRQLERNRSLVEKCVQQCMDYVSSDDKSCDVSRVTDMLDKHSLGSSHRTRYTESEVDYLYFYHSISLLGCVLMYNDGYKLFPINVRDGDVSVTELLVSFVHILTERDEPSLKSPEQNGFDLASLVTEILKFLCFTKSSCSLCLCKDAIVSELLRPVHMWLMRNKACSDSRMLHIADVLSTMASWEVGRKLLLYGEKGSWVKENSSAPIHAIAEYTKQALDGKLSSSLCMQPSRSVAGAFLYVCRQLYSTCDGLLVLHRYGLHQQILNCWRQVCRELELAGTPTPSDAGIGYDDDNDDETGGSGKQTSSKTQEADVMQAWERTLIDNLLNFASTPKGLHLLQQTGAINECIAYMYNRSARKLQVSKTEKFGYGSMVTQVAATAPGIVALQRTGFIQAVVHGLWSVLECGSDGQPMIRPNPISVEPMDRMAHKFFIRMINMFSAFPALYEILASKPLPRKDAYSLREAPNDVLGFIERLIMVDSDAKINSLFNYEQSHIFGLKLLTVLTTCLDSLLLLETQYHIWDMLLQGQECNRNGESVIMIDMLSIERNHILVRTNVIGGPTERILPPHSLQADNSSPYPWPLFSAFPVPKDYTPSLPRSSSIKQENELSKLLGSNVPVKTASEAQAWLAKCQNAFVTCLSKKPQTVTNRLLADLLDQVLSNQLHIPGNEVFQLKPCKVSDIALKGQKLPALQMLGVKMVVRYGQHLRLLSNSNESIDNLSLLLKTCRYYLNSQQRSIHSNMRCLEGEYIGHDWFVSTIFLLLSGNRDKAWSMLHKCFSVLSSGYLSMARLHASVHIPYDVAASSIHPVFYRTSHNVELILQTEVPHVYSAFRMSGYTPSQICQQWLCQCFLNYLDWPDISHYIALCIIMGADYQVYMCVAVLMYLQHKILLHTQKQQLQVFLKEKSIEGFHVADHLDYMQSLAKKYRSTVLSDMSNLSLT